jgi:hypothetical protein
MLMKAFEFQAAISPNGTVTLPPEVVSQVGPCHPIRFILLVDESEDEVWAGLTADQFLKGYDAGDALYDNVSGR